jgi:hypothetical protein
MKAAANKDMVSAGAQAVQDISGAMLKAAGECLKVHGPDPMAPAILTAAFGMTVDSINSSIDPTFKRRLMLQLAEPFK